MVEHTKKTFFNPVTKLIPLLLAREALCVCIFIHNHCSYLHINILYESILLWYLDRLETPVIELLEIETVLFKRI